LDISRHWIRAQGSQDLKLVCDFLPHEKEEGFRKKFLGIITHYPSRSAKSFLTSFFPVRFAEVLLNKLNIPQTVSLNQLKKADRETLIRAMFYFPLPVTGHLGYEKAEVTAGGVTLTEVNRSTLESKLQAGLFFAGEILDVDGRIGGFNFHWAWASGIVAARGIIKVTSN
jgi:hypothetical protein